MASNPSPMSSPAKTDPKRSPDTDQPRIISPRWVVEFTIEALSVCRILAQRYLQLCQQLQSSAASVPQSQAPACLHVPVKSDGICRKGGSELSNNSSDLFQSLGIAATAENLNYRRAKCGHLLLFHASGRHGRRAHCQLLAIRGACQRSGMKWCTNINRLER